MNLVTLVAVNNSYYRFSAMPDHHAPKSHLWQLLLSLSTVTGRYVTNDVNFPD